jgi:methionyl-tRNA formyltransferase
MVAGRSLRIVFFGTPAFAVPTLEALLESRHQVVAVVTQPDRPRGRGHKTAFAPVKARAVEAGLPILQPERLKDPSFLDAMSAFTADLGVVAAYGKILPEVVLAGPPLGMVNVHASLLPKYRGAAPIHRAVVAGEEITGVTIMRVVKALDAGPMLASAPRPIGPDESSVEVERDLARIGADLLCWTVDDLAASLDTETEQDGTRATYAHRLTKEDGIVDWSWSASRIHNLIRGLHPWPHAVTYLGDRRLILLRSAVALDAASTEAPGAILRATGDELLVTTGDGVLRLLEVQAEGGRPMGVREFMAGHHLMRGDRFRAAP